MEQSPECEFVREGFGDADGVLGDGVEVSAMAVETALEAEGVGDVLDSDFAWLCAKGMKVRSGEGLNPGVVWVRGIVRRCWGIRGICRVSHAETHAIGVSPSVGARTKA